MADSEVEDWLGVAVGTVLDFPARILDKAALEARRTCTHHSQIVPAIVREAETLLARERSLAEASAGVVSIVPPARRLAPPRMSEEELQQIAPQLRKIGLSAGWLTQNEDGSIRWTEETAA